ncbi:hypothetical protein B808_544 [Fructilactobacillus florum 8D]|uniref:Uncharacterized protein n=2 Tax=Fructilactobacillus florum TaxID=640331 RepID=W9EGX1_9LACO|nr:hypothetical protein [Fructilactobacillus florum]EKK21047.1 hypothetical protein B807_217 [Fructilactobacillus florum 2F]ETO40491.1 hypothetical protein B808_544 [Fructilactobacillus florum 8D]KRM91325.1 hypothetical protein FC87_GL001046 [Fructilactobacillus florum DSM 22689 = JCM 16035]
MSETIFFNPGNSLGNFQDYQEAVRSAQIYRNQHQNLGDANVIVVHGTQNQSFDIFLTSAAETDANTTKPYEIKKKL